MGTKLLINGKEYVAQDVGGGVKGNHIDIYFNTHGETREHGVRNAEVFIIQS
jgi:3D (Asp-Asp-Asp) domain-containing protein